MAMEPEYAAGVDKRRPEIRVVAEALGNVAITLDDQVAVLVDRLAPVLGPEMPAESVPATRPEKATELGRDLDGTVDRLGRTLSRINGLLVRLEL